MKRYVKISFLFLLLNGIMKVQGGDSMEIMIHGDKIKITSSMKDYIEEKLGRLNKYLEKGDNVRANVIVKVSNHSQRVEVTIPLKSVILRTEDSQQDFYAAVDKAIDKLERQIRKNKTRIATKQVKEDYGFSLEEIENEEVEETKLVRRKKVEVKPMDVEEAILQMELIGHQFYMYKDSETNKYNVVYKRNDGNYGVIESE